jgi:pyruvate formate lyase activating enzyme
LLPHVDAMNVDIKAMSEAFYRRLCHGPAAPPRRTVELASGQCHVEVTNLLIPGENDAPEQIRELVDWLAGISDRIPVHFSRYYPAHKLAVPATPLSSLQRAADLAAEKLKYVYVGNADLPGTGDTRCPACRTVVIERHGYATAVTGLQGNRCVQCGREVDLVT